MTPRRWGDGRTHLTTRGNQMTRIALTVAVGALAWLAGWLRRRASAGPDRHGRDHRHCDGNGHSDFCSDARTERSAGQPIG